MALENNDVDVSVIIPVYNCNEWIVSNLNKIYNYFNKLENNWELIVVDDGSVDNTVDKIKKADIYHYNNFMLLKNGNNLGKGSAVLKGLRASRGECRIFADCDLAYPLSELKKVIDKVKSGADVAIANRRIPGSICELDPLLFNVVHSRERYGRILNKLIRMLGLTNVRDTQAGLKGFNKWVIEQIGQIESKRFGFDIELLYKSSLLGAEIESVPVRYQFFENQSSVKIFRDGFKIMYEILSIWVQHIKIKNNNFL